DFNFAIEIINLFAIDQRKSPNLTLYVVAASAFAKIITAITLVPITVDIILLCTYVNLPNINPILFVSITLTIIQFNLTLLYIIYITLLLQSKPFVISNETCL